MERFAPALRRIAAELDLPRGARTELLLEMAADLDATYEHHRARGLSEDESARRAEATVLGSSEVIRRLGRLHVSPWRGWASEMGLRLSSGLDRVLLVVGVLPTVATAVGVSVWVLAERPSPLAWSILLVGVLMVVVAARESVRHLRDGARRGAYLQTLLVLAVMAPALGLLAPVLGLRRVTGLTGGAPDQVTLLTTVIQDGATLLAGLLVGVGGLLVWFVLLELEARRAAREVDALLGEGVRSPEQAVIPLVRRRQG